MLSRFEIPQGQTRLITNHGSANVTLWVDTGTVELVDDSTVGAPLEGGPIPLGNGPVTVKNSGPVTAVVFAAMGQVSADPQASVSLASANEAVLYAVYCPDEPSGAQTLTTGLSAPAADAYALNHNTSNPGHHADRVKQT